MKKKIAIVCLCVVVIAISICFILLRKNKSSNFEIVRISKYYEQEISDAENKMRTESDKADESTGVGKDKFDIDKRIEELSDIEIKEYDKQKGQVTCIIKAPDMYNYVMENLELIVTQTDAETYDFLVTYLESGNYENRIYEVVTDAIDEKNRIIINDNSYEFQDAIHGGMNSLLTELMLKSLEEISREELE